MPDLLIIVLGLLGWTVFCVFLAVSVFGSKSD